jgi:hypothetical protein
MSFEIFEYLPEKTIVCYGSASHLYRVGASLYAQEWVECNSRISGKWRSVSAVPLIPIIRDDCPGSLMRDLEQLATWIGRVYSADVRGLLDAWRGVLQATKDFCRGTTVAENTEMFKNPMPSSFDSNKLEPHCYISNTTCPAVLSGLDRKATTDLVCALTRNLHKNFSVPQDPEIFLARSNNTTGESAKDNPSTNNSTCGTYIVIGSSIMGRVVGHLRALNVSVIDLTCPGWIATQNSIDALISRLSTLDCPENIVVIMDLHSNTTFRYRQFDGTPALPAKDGSSGRYHFPGDVTLTDDALFKKITDSLGPVLLSAQSKLKILIPPLPRYVFDKCCGNPAHCTNCSDPEHPEKILNGVTRLRNVLKKHVGELGVSNFWVLDGTGIGAILGVDSGNDRGGNREVLAELHPLLGRDGVHFSEVAYNNIARVIIRIVTNLTAGTLGKKTLTGSATNTSVLQEQQYYWHGFTSPCGSTRPRAHHHRPGEALRTVGGGLRGPGHGRGHQLQHHHQQHQYQYRHERSGPWRPAFRGRGAAPHHHPY